MNWPLIDLSDNLISFFILAGLTTLVYALTLLVIRRYKQRHVISSANIRFVGWFFIYVLLVLFNHWFREPFNIRLLRNGLVFMEYLALWFTVKHFINGFYADFYLNRIKGRAFSSITLDLFKFIALLFIFFGYLNFFFEVNINSILTSSVILTAVIGLSMQDTIGSLISGLLIQIEKPFKLEDWIKVGDMEGRVVEISWRYTKIETLALNLIIIPNNSIAQNHLLNYSAPTPVHCRRLTIGVAYHIPPVRVKEALKAILKNCRLVLESPIPSVRVDEYGDFRITYKMIFFIQCFEHHVDVIDEIYSGIWYEFRKRNIEIPFPVRSLIAAEKQFPEPEGHALEMLPAIHLFDGMPAEDLSILVRFSDIRSYPPQTRIVIRGDKDTTFYVILQGRVAVRHGDQQLAELNAGQFFGEMALLTGEPRNADVVSLEQTRCLLIDREAFRVILEHNPLIVRNVKAIFSQRYDDNRSHQEVSVTSQSHETLFSRFREIFAL